MKRPNPALQWCANRFGRTVLPLELILFVTHRCNLRCSHCFLSKYDTSPDDDLPLPLIESLAKDLPDLLVLMLTGGEPFVRQDFPDVVAAFLRHSRPRVISITTNGLMTAKILRDLETILSAPGFDSQLVVTLSFEGIGDQHDANRNRAGAYRAAMETARGIKQLRTRFSRLACGANLTLIPANAQTVMQTAVELQGTGLFAYLSHNIVREGKPRRACADISMALYRQLSALVLKPLQPFRMGSGFIFGAWHRLKERYQAHLIAHTCQQQCYCGIRCEAGRGIGVVYADGRVAPCELLPADWGDLHQDRFADIWNRSANRQASSRLRTDKCFCTHECFIGASINLQPLAMLKCLAWNMRLRKHP